MSDNRFSERARRLFFDEDGREVIDTYLVDYIDKRCGNFGIARDDPIKAMKLLAVLAVKFDEKFDTVDKLRKKRRSLLDREEVYSDIIGIKKELGLISTRAASRELKKRSPYREKYSEFSCESIRKAYADHADIVKMFQVVFAHIEQSESAGGTSVAARGGEHSESIRDRGAYGDW